MRRCSAGKSHPSVVSQATTGVPRVGGLRSHQTACREPASEFLWRPSGRGGWQGWAAIRSVRREPNATRFVVPARLALGMACASCQVRFMTSHRLAFGGCLRHGLTCVSRPSAGSSGGRSKAVVELRWQPSGWIGIIRRRCRCRPRCNTDPSLRDQVIAVAIAIAIRYAPADSCPVSRMVRRACSATRPAQHPADAVLLSCKDYLMPGTRFEDQHFRTQPNDGLLDAQALCVR